MSGECPEKLKFQRTASISAKKSKWIASNLNNFIATEFPLIDGGNNILIGLFHSYIIMYIIMSLSLHLMMLPGSYAIFFTASQLDMNDF